MVSPHNCRSRPGSRLRNLLQGNDGPLQGVLTCGPTLVRLLALIPVGYGRKSASRGARDGVFKRVVKDIERAFSSIATLPTLAMARSRSQTKWSQGISRTAWMGPRRVWNSSRTFPRGEGIPHGWFQEKRFYERCERPLDLD